MKLIAFRIKNYRSVVDTGWTKLSPDNITTLIGQNESGKTSILEGLQSFRTANIVEDILRSDQSLPSISCEFSLSMEEVELLVSQPGLPQEIIEIVQAQEKLFLTRSWNTKNDSSVIYGDDNLLNEYNTRELADLQLDLRLIQKSDDLMGEVSKLKSALGECEGEEAQLLAKMNDVENRRVKIERLLQKSKNDRKVLNAQTGLSEIKGQERNMNDNLTKIQNSENRTKDQIEGLATLYLYAQKLRRAYDVFIDNKRNLKLKKQEIGIIKEKLNYIVDEKIIFQMKSDLADLSNELVTLQETSKGIETTHRFSRECLSLALKETPEQEIEEIAWDRIGEYTGLPGLEEAGMTFFQYLPDFKLFEDFSSLLPNKIDLDDILNLRYDTEGYNAARNFLIVSGLEASFFIESNNRILKQKIENLNGEITFDFQGYWRQQLGSQNKIKLNFELEHYDLSHPEKKGKPYLEFWIKDQHERLYPKQRSRGVRWFLSFYLELKATSLEKNPRGKLLLIDEPGLSLHARAQEDVLKVFEDLKEDIQVIYTTHSPHLVDTNKLYRLLAVQRADEYNDRSETRVFDVHELASVSGDTLSPIYTLLGAQISESNFISEKNNIIVENNASFYYLNCLFGIFEPELTVHFLPSTNVKNIPVLMNLLTGWKINFGVLMCGGGEGEEVLTHIREEMHFNDVEELSSRIAVLDGLEGIEDLFSTIDFKKFVLGKREGITESNTGYLKSNNLKRIDLASGFALYSHTNKLTPNDFDEETQKNVQEMVEKMKNLL